jgi:hypothetical protein
VKDRLESIIERGQDRDDIFLRGLFHVMRVCCNGRLLPEAIYAKRVVQIGQAFARVLACNAPLAHSTIVDEDTFLSSQKWRCLSIHTSDPLYEHLLTMLMDTNPHALDAICILRTIGEALASRLSVVEALVGLLSHADSEVLCRAAGALGRMGEAAASGPGVVEALVGLLS